MITEFKYLSTDQWLRLLDLASKADAEASRLDEGLRLSRFKEGWRARMDVKEAQACLWNEGAFVDQEDLVLYDQGAHVKAPGLDVIRGWRMLSARRHLWRLRSKGDLEIRDVIGLAKSGYLSGSVPGSGSQGEPWDMLEAPSLSTNIKLDQELDDDEPNDDWDYLKQEEDPLEREFDHDPLLLLPDHDEERTSVRDCLEKISGLEGVSGVLKGALAHRIWRIARPLEGSEWFGFQLSASLALRERRVLQHLPCPAVGRRSWLRSHGRAPKTLFFEDITAFIEASRMASLEGIELLKRLELAGQVMSAKASGRRSNSKMGELIELSLELPVITTAIVAKRLSVSPQAALIMIREAGSMLRELSGRKRYQVWGVL